MKLIICGIVVHLLFLASIFDIYFNSPVLHGIKVFQPSFEPAADRLVLFVADGLRANSFFSNSNHSPYLHSVILNRGSWGVSHTRVPTESRPGHVAMIAGLYEDPSAVTKGWKENPVEFDSVFNRSYHTWAWGSADILPMFAKGEASGRVTTFTYPKSMQRFSGDGSNEKLDTWVFQKVQQFFKTYALTQDSVKKPAVIFFLHLLGIDTAGHATKPHSKEYLDNIKLVDDGIERIEEAIEEFFDYDGKTVYVFTSDHGMTDWGSHGAGLPDETETPLVVWGSGIKGPERVPAQHSPGHWGLQNLERNDVEQADVAALMAALLGIPTPTNNVGILPKKYINKSQDWIFEALYSNAQQILLQLERAKMLVHEKLFEIFTLPYPKLNVVEEWQTKISTSVRKDEIGDEMDQIFKIALEGIEYYQNYFGSSLKLAITYAHFLWMLYLVTRLICKPRISPKHSSFILFDIFNAVVILTAGILIIAQNLPLQYILYYSLPSVLLWAMCRDIDLWWPQVAPLLRKHFFNIMVTSFAVGLGIGCLVASFFERSVLSIALLVIALWPALHKVRGSNLHWGIAILWTTTCMVLAIFPLLPVVGKEANYWLVFIAGMCITITGSAYTWFIKPRYQWILFSQCCLVLVSTLNVQWTTLNFDSGLGLTTINQVISWAVVVFSVISPFLVAPNFGSKMLSTSLSISAVFLLLSVRHEAFFLFLLLTLLNLYPSVEMQIPSKQDLFLILSQPLVTSKEKPAALQLSDIRKAYFYLFFTILAFFGIGNIASLNSFDPAWVRTLVTTFAPHLMGGLILVKTVLPFFAVACSIASVSILNKRPVQWLLVLAMCDMMALPFFHLVQTKGSWLDVGQSISHFVIAHVCILFLLLLHWAAQELLALRRVPNFLLGQNKRNC